MRCPTCKEINKDKVLDSRTTDSGSAIRGASVSGLAISAGSAAPGRMTSTGLGFGKGGGIFRAAAATITAGMKQAAIIRPRNAMRLMRCSLLPRPVLTRCEVRYGPMNGFIDIG